MKISDLSGENNRMQYVNQANASNKAEKSSPSQEAKDSRSSDDRVDLSTRSKEMQKVHDVLQTIPDVRAEKVSQYKKQIEDDKYRGASKDLAGKMLKESILDLF